MSAGKVAESVPSLRQALELTGRTLERRTRLFRNTVIAVVAIVMAMIVLVAIRRSPAPLLGMPAIVPIVGLYLILDRREVTRWRHGIVLTWPNGEHDRAVFEQTIGGFRHVPTKAVAAMLAGLPKAPPDTRNAQRAERRAQLTITGATLVLTAGLAGVATGIYRESAWMAAVGFVMVLLLIAFRRGQG